MNLSDFYDKELALMTYTISRNVYPMAFRNERYEIPAELADLTSIDGVLTMPVENVRRIAVKQWVN